MVSRADLPKGEGNYTNAEHCVHVVLRWATSHRLDKVDDRAEDALDEVESNESNSNSLSRRQ